MRRKIERAERAAARAAAGANGPGVVLIGLNGTVLVATEAGARLIAEAAAGVAECIRGDLRRGGFCDAVIRVLRGRTRRACVALPRARGRVFPYVSVVPAYDGEGKRVVGAIAVMGAAAMEKAG